jgi:hypothetical protein
MESTAREPDYGRMRLLQLTRHETGLGGMTLQYSGLLWFLAVPSPDRDRVCETS